VDLRLQSKALDGVPDALVENIAGRLMRLVAAHVEINNTTIV
jgi:hypothetical protein